ncbi:hypothetical protein L1987_43455 [Smallanthus sonchifolius]|uniref:Uncharacterized protein n=1 Tax=Smallanthus sonchifolius TaxID=185202 RepID=A0ACB9GLN1_9ASTR|nr:hypothetical protein L1987_43455 [Smallanthus sonchifolius]
MGRFFRISSNELSTVSLLEPTVTESSTDSLLIRAESCPRSSRLSVLCSKNTNKSSSADCQGSIANLSARLIYSSLVDSHREMQLFSRLNMDDNHLATVYRDIIEEFWINTEYKVHSVAKKTYVRSFVRGKEVLIYEDVMRVYEKFSGKWTPMFDNMYRGERLPTIKVALKAIKEKKEEKEKIVEKNKRNEKEKEPASC